MYKNEHLFIIINRLEYYLTKEIEKNIYGIGDECYLAIYDRLVKWIMARKTIDYKPYQSVEELLEQHGYDKLFINKFINRVHYCKNDKFEDDEILSVMECMIIVIDILEYYIKKIIVNWKGNFHFEKVKSIDFVFKNWIGVFIISKSLF